MAKRKMTLVFVHGYSVTNTNSYGGMPPRLQKEAAARKLDLDVRHVFLGRYISFHDEVRLPDISRAFDNAVRTELASVLADDSRFACITHSTGGPVIRDWWQRHYAGKRKRCPMSHLIMLAPANFGSALAQLGKGRLGRLKAWFQGVEPGQGVLDWLELGSVDGWELNRRWIESDGKQIGAGGIFPFVLTGQSIDRKLYDNLNSYTGETGSDGVVRVAAANVNATLVTLEQETPRAGRGGKDGVAAPLLVPKRPVAAPEAALRVISGASHSGTRMGIVRSVSAEAGNRKGEEVVDAILECLEIRTRTQYSQLVEKHRNDTNAVQAKYRVERDDRRLLPDQVFIHDRYSMVVFRVSDDRGHRVDDFDLLLTAGPSDSPDHLPKGFFADRQRNRLARNTVTYFLNYDLMVGSGAVEEDGRTYRDGTAGVESLGLIVRPRPHDGFVHYLPCSIKASRNLLNAVLKPNATTLVDIRLRRVVHQNVFRLDKLKGDSTEGGFKRTRPGKQIVD